VAAVAALTLILNLRLRRRHLAIAETRPPLDKRAFAESMHQGGVSNDVSGFLWNSFIPYCCKPLTPHPADRVFYDLEIDPDDLGISYLPTRRSLGCESLASRWMVGRPHALTVGRDLQAAGR
jgi:hypothetical protein